jgi:phytol kinase
MLDLILFIGAQLSGVGLILIFAERLRWSRWKVSAENLRKMVHILVGLWVATWPNVHFSDNSIILSLLALVLVNVALKYPVPGRKYLRQLYRLLTGARGKKSVFNLVSRTGYGEVSYGLGLLISALYSQSVRVFTASVLILTLADGWAAVIGSKYGKHKIKYFSGGKKSVEGSLTFFIVCIAILIISQLFSAQVAVLLAIVLTGVELASCRGEDNLLLPVLVVVATNFA